MAVLKPSVTLEFDPAGPEFQISEQCEMPKIKATANFQNFTPAAGANTSYRWTVRVVFAGGKSCPFSLGRVTAHKEITRTTQANTFDIAFDQIRGGDLEISVAVQSGTTRLLAASKGLQIVGTNPTIATLSGAAPAKVMFRKLMRLESKLRQFRTPACPLFSQDGLGGVGICQITRPKPTDDQVWSWKENMAAGWALYQQKEKIARAYPALVRGSQEFRNLVARYNADMADRVHANSPKAVVPNIPVYLPDYTEQQLELDTIRGFNGYAAGLHEFRPKVDANGILVTDSDERGAVVSAQWERLSAQQRTDVYDTTGLATNRRGDPNYVADVERQDSF